MNRTKLTGRTAFRLAAIFAGIITLTNILIFSILYFVISQQLSTHLKAHVDEVLKTLVDVDETGGFDALASMVGRHALVAGEVGPKFRRVCRGGVDQRTLPDRWCVGGAG